MQLHNLVDPAILFFVVGVTAGLLRSNLEVPAPISRFLSMYLLMALGLKGGFALADSGLNAQVLAGLGIAVVLLMMWRPQGLVTRTMLERLFQRPPARTEKGS